MEEEAGLVRTIVTIIIIAHCITAISNVSQLHCVVNVTGYRFMNN